MRTNDTKELNELRIRNYELRIDTKGRSAKLNLNQRRDLIKEDEREESLNFVLKSGNVYSMTIGMENTQLIDDTVIRVMRIART